MIWVLRPQKPVSGEARVPLAKIASFFYFERALYQRLCRESIVISADTAGSSQFRRRRGARVEIEVRNRGEVKLIKLTGRLTLGDSVDRLRATLDDLLATGANRYVLDLGDVSMLDSSGIGLLVMYLNNAKQRGGSLKLLNPSKFAVQTLKMIGLLKLFDVFQDSEEAVASFQV
jgi:anti-sigma B factor antagonist